MYSVTHTHTLTFEIFLFFCQVSNTTPPLPRPPTTITPTCTGKKLEVCSLLDIRYEITRELTLRIAPLPAPPSLVVQPPPHYLFLCSYHQLNTNALGAGGAFFPGAQSLLAKGGGGGGGGRRPPPPLLPPPPPPRLPLSRSCSARPCTAYKVPERTAPRLSG